MTHVIMHPSAPRSSETASQQGPVLLATKAGHGADAPAAVARWLAGREERELRVVTVIEPTGMLAAGEGMAVLPPWPSAEECAALAEELKRELTVESAGGPTPVVEVLDRLDAASVVDVARARDARVIVIGSGHHDALGRLLHGERAMEILAAADRPVLIVPRDAHAGPVATAVVAVDFSAASIRAARALIPMLSDGSRVILAHVKPASTLRDDTAHPLDEPYERRCADLFAEFRRQLPSLPGVAVETRILYGDPARSILEHAKLVNAGLIACGRLGHSLMQRMLVGSVSSSLVRHANCPVLVAPATSVDATPAALARHTH